MRHLKVLTLSLLLGTGLSIAADPTESTGQLPADVARTFDLADGHVVRPAIQGELGAPVRVTLELAGQPVVLDLLPHTVLAAGFRLIEQRDGGELVDVPTPIERNYRGTVVGEPGAIVAGSWLDEGLYARIRRADGSDLWIQPLASHLSGYDGAAHVLYENDDVIAPPFACGTKDMHQIGVPVQGGGVPAANAVAELACDADYDYYTDYGSSSTNVMNRITSVVNTLDLQYGSEVGIDHSITTILVRTSKGSNPYKGKGANRLLDQMRGDWESNHDSIPRDTTHLFTGISVAGGTIGIAYVGVICHPSYAYGLAQSDFNNNFACATDLSAHELGHNWSANHCSCTSYTMNPYITCANTFNPVGTRPSIIGHRDSRTCLD